MNKEEIVRMYQKEEDRLLVAKMLDQVSLCKKRNKLQHTDFLDKRQVHILEKAIHRMDIQNYVIYGGFEEAERQIVFFGDLEAFGSFLDEKFGSGSQETLYKGRGNFPVSVAYQLGKNTYKGRTELQYVMRHYS